MPTKQPHDHGTIGGYTNNQCRCQPCRNAWATYVKKYRQENKTRLRKQIRARNRAYTQLAKQYPTQFKTLYTQELNKETTP